MGNREQCNCVYGVLKCCYLFSELEIFRVINSLAHIS